MTWEYYNKKRGKFQEREAKMKRNISLEKQTTPKKQKQKQINQEKNHFDTSSFCLKLGNIAVFEHGFITNNHPVWCPECSSICFS